jgi:hypothetical protein
VECSEKARRALPFGCAGCIFSAIIVIVAGCQTKQPGVPRAEKTTPDASQIQVAPAVSQVHLEQLIDAADLAFSEDRLTYPAKDSALVLYERVLVLDPGNTEALRGMEKIAERYLQFAQRAAERRQFAEARSMLSRAHLVDPDNAALEPTESQIRLLESAKREKVTLDRKLLRERSTVLSAPLQRLGREAKRNGCRVMITARNDAEGRWVYQEMSKSEGAERIRAQVQIASPPAVEITCFDSAT